MKRRSEQQPVSPCRSHRSFGNLSKMLAAKSSSRIKCLTAYMFFDAELEGSSAIRSRNESKKSGEKQPSIKLTPNDSSCCCKRRDVRLAHARATIPAATL